jgi:type III secretion system low calcium response chaperone LcrH/SycD
MVAQTKEREEITHAIQTFVNRQNTGFSPHERDVVIHALTQMIVEQKTLKDIYGFTPAMLEVVYQYGYTLFKAGKYQEALLAFDYAKRLDPLDTRYPFSLAASHHYLKHYAEAAENYKICTTLDPSNPLPYFHAYDCYLKIGDLSSARDAIQHAVKAAEKQPQYAQLKQKAQFELEYVQEMLKQKEV